MQNNTKTDKKKKIRKPDYAEVRSLKTGTVSAIVFVLTSLGTLFKWSFPTVNEQVVNLIILIPSVIIYIFTFFPCFNRWFKNNFRLARACDHATFIGVFFTLAIMFVEIFNIQKLVIQFALYPLIAELLIVIFSFCRAFKKRAR